MSEAHGGKEMQKPVSEYAKYRKNLLPLNIPENYELNPIFENVAKDGNIQKGIIAFRDFLYLFFDRLVSDGDLYVKPQNRSNPEDYPFLQNINQLLIEIGSYGKLNESGDSIIINEIPLFTAPKPQISFPKQAECMRFLTQCGFVFSGIDIDAKKLTIPERQLIEVSYPENPILLTGLKALAISAENLAVRFNNNAHDLLRCDYRTMKAENTDELEILKDILHLLPKKLQKFAINLHQRYVNMGLTCITLYDNTNHFAYAYTKTSKRALSKRDIYQMRLWSFAVSMKHGYSLIVRPKKTDKYEDTIEKFSPYLKEKIKKGYGCDRKRNEACQGGCIGIILPLDDKILEIKQDIEIWLDNELPQSLKK